MGILKSMVSRLRRSSAEAFLQELEVPQGQQIDAARARRAVSKLGWLDKAERDNLRMVLETNAFVGSASGYAWDRTPEAEAVLRRAHASPLNRIEAGLHTVSAFSVIGPACAVGRDDIFDDWAVPRTAPGA